MLSSPIITLTTDWGTRDFFCGMVKGRLFSRIEGVRVVDITHDIPRGDLTRASFIIRSGCMGFPPGTVHMIDVGSEWPYVVIRFHEQYFICSDNGLPHSVFGNDFSDAVKLEVSLDDGHFFTFPGYSLFCQVAQELCGGTPLSALGPPVSALNPMRAMGYMEMSDSLVVYVNYIDLYGNADLSIRYDQFEQVRRGRAFRLPVREYEVRRLSHTYSDITPDPANKQGVLLTVSASGYLQIALPNKSVQQLVGLRVLEQFRFKFLDQSADQ